MLTSCNLYARNPLCTMSNNPSNGLETDVVAPDKKGQHHFSHCNSSSAFLPRQIIVKRYVTNSCCMAETASSVPSNTEPSAVDEKQIEVDFLETSEIKSRLLDLLPRMKGSSAEFREVETLVNALEAGFTPVQTLDFLNLAMAGDWQLLFSTNLAGGQKPNFRLREMFQRVESKSATSFEGRVSNEVAWEFAEDGTNFNANGSFTVVSKYEINQGARQILQLEDSILKLSKGSALPKDVENLVGLLNRAMPKELFDPSDHAVDTTYLDGDLRITRMTGSRFEGVRDIFVRRGSMEINPVGQCS
eukprot:scaffold26289_cov264-Cylindrotheca_fusiformis.AAC.1